MTVRDDLQRCIELLRSKNYEVTIALAIFPEDADFPTLRSLNIHDRVADQFKEILADRASKYHRQLEKGDLRLHEYTTDVDTRDHEIEYLELSEDDAISELLRSIPPPSQVPLIGDLDDFIAHVRFYVVYAVRGNQRVTLFRRFGPNKELRRSKNPIVALYGERYDRLREPALQFDTSFDAMMYRDNLFILQKNNFQHIFRYYEMLREAAQESLQEIEEAVPIENVEEFRSSCLSHLLKLAKLRNIAQKGYLQTITVDQLRRTIDDFGLSIEIRRVDGEEKLVFDSSDRWAILHLLEDAYLRSQMTGLRYEASSKRELDG